MLCPGATRGFAIENRNSLNAHLSRSFGDIDQVQSSGIDNIMVYNIKMYVNSNNNNNNNNNNYYYNY